MYICSWSTRLHFIVVCRSQFNYREINFLTLLFPRYNCKDNEMMGLKKLAIVVNVKLRRNQVCSKILKLNISQFSVLVKGKMWRISLYLGSLLSEARNISIIDGQLHKNDSSISRYIIMNEYECVPAHLHLDVVAGDDLVSFIKLQMELL